MADEQVAPETEEEKREPVDPDFAREVLEDIVRFEGKLREEGSSIIEVLRHATKSATGIRA